MLRSSLPSNFRTPGVTHEFDWSAAGASLVSVERRIVFVCEKTAAGTAAANTPVQLFGELDSDEKCGPGSMASLAHRKALQQAIWSAAQAPRGQPIGAPEFWACPVDANAAGTAAIFTLTFDTAATASRDAIFKLAGRLVVIGVTAGDSVTAMALALKNKCDELGALLPFTASAALGVVTLTARSKGVNGNDIKRKTVQLPAGVTVTHANPTPGAGATVIANALAALYDRQYHGIVLANHVAGDAVAVLADAVLAWSFGTKSFRHYHIGENGSLGTAQTAQGGFNDHRVQIINMEGCGSLPVEMAAAHASAWWSRERPNCNLADENLLLDPCDPSETYASAEIESALGSGVTPAVPDGSSVKIVRPVTTQITVASVAFEPLREPALSRTAGFVAWLIDTELRAGVRQEVMYQDPNGGDDVFKRTRDIIILAHRFCESNQILTDVDSFLDQIKVEPHPSVAGRILSEAPFAIAGPHYQTTILHIPYLK